MNMIQLMHSSMLRILSSIDLECWKVIDNSLTCLYPQSSISKLVKMARYIERESHQLPGVYDKKIFIIACDFTIVTRA